MRPALLLLVAGAAVALVGVAAWIALSPPAPAPSPEHAPDPEPAPVILPPDPDDAAEGAPVAGVVLDEAGEPVIGANVYLLSPDDPLVPEAGPRRTVSGEGGAFSLRMRAGEVVDLFAVRPGFRATWLEGIVPGKGHRVTLSRGAKVRGVVEDDLGRPLAGVQVTGRSAGTAIDPPRGLFLPNHSSISLTWARTLTGPDGGFTLTGVGEDAVDIEAKKRGYPETLVPPSEVEPGRTDVGIVLLRPFRAAVLVRVEDTGRPASRVQITVEPEGGGWKAVRGFTDARGEFAKPLPFPAARAPDCAVKITVFSRRLGENITKNIPLSLLAEGRDFAITVYEKSAAKLRVRLLYDTGAVYTRWGWFMLQPLAGKQSYAGGQVDAEGWTEVELAPGHYESIKLMGQRGVVSGELAGVKLTPGETREEVMTIVRGGDLKLTIEGARAGGRLRGKVRITREGSEAQTFSVWGKQAKVFDLPPGPVHLLLELQDHEPMEKSIELIKDQEVEVVLRAAEK